jgi:cephalosporin-C deacetylase
MFVDLSGPALDAHRSTQTEPADFDAFWASTLAESRAAAADEARAPGAALTVERIGTPLRGIDVYDVTFPGFRGQPIRGWLRLPADARGPLPVLVQYIGYGGGRALPTENLIWALGGFAHFIMDTRGQGATWSVGHTPDPDGTDPQFPGVMTRGVLSPETYYYRRLITDAVLAIDAVRRIDLVDGSRVALFGRSQGGGLALAAGALAPDVLGTIAQVPFLCDFPRAITITDAAPYSELVGFLSVHRREIERVHDTLRYVDGVNFARRGRVPLWVSAALMDSTCPPSTIVGAYHEWQGPKELSIWPFNGHDGGGADGDVEALEIAQRLLLA